MQSRVNSGSQRRYSSGQGPLRARRLHSQPSRRAALVKLDFSIPDERAVDSAVIQAASLSTARHVYRPDL